VLDAAQIAQYQAAGFLTMRARLETSLLPRLNAAIDRICAEAAGLTAKTAHIDLDTFHTPETPRIGRISSPTELDEVFMAWRCMAPAPTCPARCGPPTSSSMWRQMHLPIPRR
jgi:hypothetical protein